MQKYFFTDGIEKFGPYSLEELLSKNISRDTKVWFYGLPSWTPLHEIEELKDHITKVPPPLVSFPPPVPENIKTDTDSKEEKLPVIKPEKKSRNYIIWFLVIFIIFMAVLAIVMGSPERRSLQKYEEIKVSAYDSDEDFGIYLDKFYRDLNVFGIYPKKPKEVIIKFAKLDQIADETHVHAYSFGYENDDLIEIYINPSSWEKFNKPKRYLLMYHELAHDILNLDDLSAIEENKGKLMYPSLESYERVSMDEFIEAYQQLFEEVSSF